MTRCQCASERRPDTATKQFRWGGCSDNVKHGKRVARNFLELQPFDGEGDESTVMLRHDSEVGITTVVHSLGEKCKCHGKSHFRLGISSQLTPASCAFRRLRKLLDADMLAKAQRIQHNGSCTTCEISSGNKKNLDGESVTSCCKPRTSRASSYDWNRLHWSLSWYRDERVAAGPGLRAAILSGAVADILCGHQRPAVSQSR